jgi:hypothetical protein
VPEVPKRDPGNGSYRKEHPLKFLFVGALIGGLIFLTYLASRGPNPVNDARAYEIQLKAEADAAARAQQLQAQTQLNEIKIQERAARSAAVRAAWATFVKWTGRAATLATLISVLALGISFVMWSTGRAKAAVEAAQLSATLIYVDKETGQLPTIIRAAEDGHLLSTDLNTGLTRLLDTSNPADAQLAAGAIAIRYAGTIARLAAKTNDGDVTGNIDTPIIHPQIVDLESLTHLLEQNQDRSEDA